MLAFPPGRNIGAKAQNTALGGRTTWAIGGYWKTAAYSSFPGAKDALSNAIGFDVTGRPMLNHVHVLVNSRRNPPPVDAGRTNIWQARMQLEF